MGAMNARRARAKLAEARFFLAQLDERGDGRFDRDPQAFGFYLSAFLNAGYSVTQMIRMELTRHVRQQGRKRGKGGSIGASFMEEWAASLAERDRKAWEWMDMQRHAEVHREGVEIQVGKKLEPVKPRIDYEHYARGAFRYHPAYYMQAMSVSPALLGIQPEEWVPAGVWREALVHEFTVGEERRGVAEVCGQYFGLIEQLIVAAEKAADDPDRAQPEGSKPR